MFTLTKEFTFEAAHKLPAHDGKCARLHGHSWKMRVIVQGENLDGKPSPKAGMLMDFSNISKVVAPIYRDQLDHHYLNETTGLENPTSEELARWIYNQLRLHFEEDKFVDLVAVEVDETCTSSCRYEEEA